MSRAGQGDRSSRNPAACSTVRPPRPTSASTPTTRRTIFQMKCDPLTRTSTRSPCSSIRIGSSATFVEPSSGSASVKERKSWSPEKRAAVSRIGRRSSGSFTHQTYALAKAVRRRASW